MSKKDKGFDYSSRINKAMREVIKGIMKSVADDNSLPGKHHFYITFSVMHPDVSMSEYLTKKHPEQMTIILQHQFKDLIVNNDSFSVTLSFNCIPERIKIPFNAITNFTDPHASFSVQFELEEEFNFETDNTNGDSIDNYKSIKNVDNKNYEISLINSDNLTKTKNKKTDKKNKTNVIYLDDFRKK